MKSGEWRQPRNVNIFSSTEDVRIIEITMLYISQHLPIHKDENFLGVFGWLAALFAHLIYGFPSHGWVTDLSVPSLCGRVQTHQLLKPFASTRKRFGDPPMPIQQGIYNATILHDITQSTAMFPILSHCPDTQAIL
ncbi:hypothetical protein I7I50_10004 [Histoplasma capsulatum G186AR]|uniref:Uncharacterized protein n=1 Tax=Ajellomyces capsulatus TaxID=5037 RepID=A0A8H8D6Z2_AJECA|nr:hypothetical protein I7I52_01242 [Histoplasma capsulatum]QSS68887.1 hypothetical protein I7I50_10004 [Histoplasma capsulatum G186AR]